MRGIIAGHHRSDRPKVNADKADGVNRRHKIRSAPPTAKSPTPSQRKGSPSSVQTRNVRNSSDAQAQAAR
jgi:hypothetical protein